MNKDKRCCICGQPGHIVYIEHNCDECNAFICEGCYQNIPITYVTRATRQGMVGCLKLCDTCRKSHLDSQEIKVTNTPYIN